MIDRRAFLGTAARALGVAAITPDLAWSSLRGRPDHRPNDALGSGRADARGADLVLRGGTVYDGTGSPGRTADVAIAGDRIVAVGRDLPGRGSIEVDVRGLAVAPGFIDIHSHSDTTVLVDPRARGKILQGVTTEVVGADGGSVGPVSGEAARRRRERFREAHGVDFDARDLGGYFATLDRQPPAVNIASMVGAGQVRGFVIGEDDRPARPDELERMAEEVRRALAQGACGLSSGLEYTPGGFADLDELVALASPLRGTGLPYASHMRNEDDRLLAAMEEAVNVGRFAGVPVEISHLKAQGQRNWWKAGPALALLDAAREDGVEVGFDVYPYVAYSTTLANLFPLWTRDGGDAAFRARLADPSLRATLEAAVQDKVGSLGSWDAVQVTSTADPAFHHARGRRLGELATERGEEPYGLLVAILTAGGGGMVGFGMSEENVARFLAHPRSTVVSDGSALAADGPLSDGTPHPRNYGTFPRVLARYVRERGALPLEDAIRKMTSEPARRVRLADRGRIADGMFADVVVFDPARVADRATYEEPHQYATGIEHVLVNGQITVREGEQTEARAGRALRGPAAT